MMDDTRFINERREGILREVEANRLAKKLRGSRRDESLAAVFARELKLDFIRLAGVFRRSGEGAKWKERL